MTSQVAANSTALDQFAIASKAPDKSSDEMGRNEFMELMIAQMNNQNPLKPQENGDFIAQLAQFSSLEGIERMSGSMEDLSSNYKSNQALTASSLVGGSVTVDGSKDSNLRWGDVIHGSADVPSGSDGLVLSITDENGQVVEEVDLGYQPNGELNFKWDGMYLEVNGELFELPVERLPKDSEGNPIPFSEGEYSFAVSGSNFEGEVEQMDLSMSSRVESVTILPDNSIRLNLAGGETASLSDVTQINDVN
jgi:flagellar basal-body rod modification protein FlgD